MTSLETLLKEHELMIAALTEPFISLIQLTGWMRKKQTDTGN